MVFQRTWLVQKFSGDKTDWIFSNVSWPTDLRDKRTITLSIEKCVC